MNQHLGVTLSNALASITIGQAVRVPAHLNPLVKLLVSTWSIINLNLIRDHEARLGTAADDQVAKVAVVRFDVALACAEG